MNIYEHTVKVGDVLRLHRSMRDNKFVSYEETEKLF